MPTPQLQRQKGVNDFVGITFRAIRLTVETLTTLSQSHTSAFVQQNNVAGLIQILVSNCSRPFYLFLLLLFIIYLYFNYCHSRDNLK